MQTEVKIDERIIKIDVQPLYDLDSMWRTAREVARKTMDNDDTEAPVSEAFKIKLLTSGHSPIRELRFKVKIDNMSVFTCQQYTRHHIALESHSVQELIHSTDVEHYVASQRPDRRNGKERGEFCNYSFTINMQGLIDASKKRLCNGAEAEAVKIWKGVRECMHHINPELSRLMHPSCVWDGGCKEIYSKCRWFETSAGKLSRESLTRDWKK